MTQMSFLQFVENYAEIGTVTRDGTRMTSEPEPDSAATVDTGSLRSASCWQECLANASQNDSRPLGVTMRRPGLAAIGFPPR